MLFQGKLKGYLEDRHVGFIFGPENSDAFFGTNKIGDEGVKLVLEAKQNNLELRYEAELGKDKSGNDQWKVVRIIELVKPASKPATLDDVLGTLQAILSVLVEIRDQFEPE
jgi:hypothetical protein